ncbi:MAG: hypothetical protein ACPL1F_07595 [bacterium]
MNDLNKDLKEIFKELKIEPIVNKVYLSKLTFFTGGISLILILIGLILIFYSINNKDALEEFIWAPLALGIIDLIFSLFYIYKNIGYSLHINSTTIEYKKFNKSIFKNNVKYIDIQYRKGLLYEYYSLSNVNNRKENIIIPSFIFSNQDFNDIKNSFSKLIKLKEILKVYKE